MGIARLMTFAEERHIDAIEDAAAELMRRARLGCAGKKELPAVVDAVRKALSEAKRVVVAEE